MRLRDLSLRAAFSVLFLFHLFSGCSERSGGLKNEVKSRYDLNTARKECEMVDFHRNSLNKNNLILGMKCLGFHKKYSKIETLIRDSNANSFNKLMLPFNEVLFSGTRARSDAINFFSNEVTENTKNEIKSIALELPRFIRDFKLFTKIKALVTLGQDFFPKEQALRDLNEFYRLSKRTSDARAKLGSFFTGLTDHKKDSFKSFSNEAMRGLLNKDDREQLKSFLDGLTLLNQESHLSQTEVKDLLVFISSMSAADINSLKNLNSFLIGDQRLSCSDRLGLDINIYREFYDQISALEAGDLKFYNGLNSLFIKLKLLEELCGEPQQTKSFRRVLGLVGEFFSLPGATELVRSFTQTTTDKTEIFDFMTGSFFKKLKSLLETLSDEELSQLSSLLAGYLGSYDVEAKLSCRVGVDLFSHEEIENTFRSLNYEKNFSNYFLVHFIAHKGALESSTMALKMFETWPNLLPSIELALKDPEILKFLVEVENKMGDPALIKNLQDFILSEDITRLFDLFLGKNKKNKPIDAMDVSEEKNAPLVFKEEEKKMALRCLKDLSEAVETQGLSKFSQEYSSACKNSLEDDMNSHLLIYALKSSSAFKGLFGRELFIGSGVFSPELLNLYVSTLVLWAQAVEIENSQDIAQELEAIETSLLGEDFVEKALTTLDFVAQNEEAQNSLTGVLLYISQMEDRDLKSVLAKTFSPHSLKRQASLPLATVASKRAVGLENETTFSKVGSREQIADNLISFIDPNVGTPLKDDVYRFDLKEGLLFIYDLTDPRFVENVYHYASGADVAFIPMHLSERIETTIWEISFLNNFYGAYFINRIAMSEDYLSEVQKLRKNIRTLDVSEGFFRRIGVYPKKTLWAFKNIYNTYGSLEEIGQSKFGPEKRSYARPTQALLKRIVLASPEQSRDFSPYRRPNLELVRGHAGVLLAKLVNQGLLTKLSLFLRENYHSEFEKRLDTIDFYELEKKFIQLDWNGMRPEVMELLEKENFYALCEVIFEEFKGLSSLQQERALSWGINLAQNILLLPPEDHTALLKFINILIPNLYAAANLDLPELMQTAAKYTSILSHAPGLLASISKDLSKALDRHGKTTISTNQINFENEILSSIILHPQFPTQSVIETLRRHFGEHGNFDYFIDVIKLLAGESETAEQGSAKSRLEVILRTILIDDHKKLGPFLLDLINKISIRSPYTLSE